jgi:hypothetical protein
VAGCFHRLDAPAHTLGKLAGQGRLPDHPPGARGERLRWCSVSCNC